MDGKPLEKGLVGLVPVDPNVGRSASGIIENGKFTIMTSASAPGAVIGKYRISVISNEIPESPPPPDQLPKSLIPVKYNNVMTSGLEVEVAKGMSPVEIMLKKE